MSGSGNGNSNLLPDINLASRRDDSNDTQIEINKRMVDFQKSQLNGPIPNGRRRRRRCNLYSDPYCKCCKHETPTPDPVPPEPLDPMCEGESNTQCRECTEGIIQAFNRYYPSSDHSEEYINRISPLCIYRVRNDGRYAKWVREGRAWWFGPYYANNETVYGSGWEEPDKEMYLPRWWWIYPEIPSPSKAWISINNRRNTHLPSRELVESLNIEIPARVNLLSDDSIDQLKTTSSSGTFRFRTSFDTDLDEEKNNRLQIELGNENQSIIEMENETIERIELFEGGQLATRIGGDFELIENFLYEEDNEDYITTILCELEDNNIIGNCQNNNAWPGPVELLDGDCNIITQNGNPVTYTPSGTEDYRTACENCGTISNGNSQNDAKIKKLCFLRSLMDPLYNDWIQNNRAWWFSFFYATNRNETAGWNTDLGKFPLPRWWWLYPEIPSPSYTWLIKNNRRNEYLPPSIFHNYVLERVRVFDPQSNWELIIYNGIENTFQMIISTWFWDDGIFYDMLKEQEIPSKFDTGECGSIYWNTSADPDCNNNNNSSIETFVSTNSPIRINNNAYVWILISFIIFIIIIFFVFLKYNK